MDHRAVRQRLSEYIDGALEGEERAAVEAHLSSCTACSGALAELKKSIGHIKKIEAMEPPPWLTSRIMAHVREEAEKRGSWRRLFPLAIRQPVLSAVAIAFVAVVAFSIYEVSRPELTLEEAPLPLPAPAERAKDIAAEKREAPALPQQRVLAKPGPESPKMAAPVMEKRAMEYEAKAVAEGAAEAPVFPDLAKARALRFGVKVADPKAASEEIKRAIAGLGGEVVASHSLGDKEIVRARIDASKLAAFSRTLGRLGQIAARPPTGEEREGVIEIQIALSRDNPE